MFSWELSWARFENADDRPFVGIRRANAADFSRVNEISYLSLNLTQLVNGRSASIDAQLPAREPLRAFGNAIGNSVRLWRELICLEP
jgi:hypothetical protein